MDTSLIISIVAVCLSGASLFVSAYSLLRDKGKVRARSELFYDSSREITPGPSMRLRAVNAGRRPVTLTALVRTGRRGGWSSSLKWPATLGPEEITALPSAIQFVAQNVSVRLAEGDAFEIIIHYDDYGEFYFVSGDDMREADNLFFEDIVGRRYRVKGARQHLAKLKAYKSVEPDKALEPTAKTGCGSA